MTKFVCLGLALALFSGCGFLGFGRGRDNVKRADKPGDERMEERGKAFQPAPEDEAPAPRVPEYVPPDFPAPWTDTEQVFQGDFWKGKELLGFDPYRSPEATGGNRGYYFAYPALVVVKKEKEEDDD